MKNHRDASRHRPAAESPHPTSPPASPGSSRWALAALCSLALSTTAVATGTPPAKGASAAAGVPSTGGTVRVPATGGSVGVPSFGSVPVPATGGAGGVPAFGSVPVPASGGPAGVPQAGRQPAAAPPATDRADRPAGGATTRGDGPSREWRAACAPLAGPRPGLKYAHVSRSGALSQLWLNADGSYSLQRSSPYSSYAEDGCYSIEGSQIAFLKVASSAMADAPAPPGGTRVVLGSATSRHAFDRSTKPISLIAGGRGGLLLDGDRYDVMR